MDTKLSAEETAVYDRQIRTWGLQAQHRIRGANVLLVNIEGLGAEIAKNLVLAGIGSLTVVDDKAISLRDLSTHFLLSKSDVGQNPMQAQFLQNKHHSFNILMSFACVSHTTNPWML